MRTHLYKSMPRLYTVGWLNKQSLGAVKGHSRNNVVQEAPLEGPVCWGSVVTRCWDSKHWAFRSVLSLAVRVSVLVKVYMSGPL